MVAASSWISNIHDGFIIRFWETATGKEVRHLVGPAWGLQALAISPDGKYIAAAGLPEVKVWRLDSPSSEATLLSGTADGANALAFSADGKRLAVASSRKNISIWEAGAWRRVCECQGHEGSCVGVAFIPDGKTLISAGRDNTVRLWNPATGEQRRVFSPKGLTELSKLALAPDGKRFCLVEGRHTVSLWSSTGEPLSTHVGAKDSCRCVAFSPDSRGLAVSGKDEVVRFFDAATGAERQSWKSSQDAWQLAFAPDGRTLAVAGSLSRRVHHAFN